MQLRQAGGGGGGAKGGQEWMAGCMNGRWSENEVLCLFTHAYVAVAQDNF